MRHIKHNFLIHYGCTMLNFYTKQQKLIGVDGNLGNHTCTSSPLAEVTIFYLFIIFHIIPSIIFSLHIISMEDSKPTVIYGEIEVFNRTPKKDTDETQTSCTPKRKEVPLPSTSSTPKRKELHTATPSSASLTPDGKRHVDRLKETIENTMSDMELYSTSAAYYFSRNDRKEGMEKLEKGKRLVSSNVKRSLYLLDELQKEMAGDKDKIRTLEKKHLQLEQQLQTSKSEKKDLQQELDQLKQEREFLEDNTLDVSETD